MGTNQNSVQRAVVLGVAVVGAGLHSTLDALVCMTVHVHFLLHFGFGFSMAWTAKNHTLLFLSVYVTLFISL